MSDMTQTPDPFTSRLRLSALLSVIVFSGGTLLNTSCADERELTADARRVTTRQDLVGGPSALGELRDFVLENDRVKVIIQDKGYSRGFGVYGGGLIDADRKRPVAPGTSDGAEGRDSFGELFPIYFLQALDPQSVEAFPPDETDPDARVVVKGDGGEFLSITKVLNRALVNSYEGTDGFDSLPDLITALGEGIDTLVSSDVPRIGFELVYRLAPNADHVVIESTMENKEEQEVRLPSDVARVLFSLPNFAGIARDPFRIPLGFVALFGAGNAVFAPGFGFDIRFNLEDRYALSGVATEEKARAKEDGNPLTAAQDRTLALPELPGLITPGLISVNPEGNSYGLFLLPEVKTLSEEERASGASEYPTSFVYNCLEPLNPDEDDSPERARNVYTKLFEDEVDPGDALIPFSASSFTGMFSAQAPEVLAPKERYTVRHAFIIGVGDVSSVMDSYYQLRGAPVATVGGEVLDQASGAPVASASVLFYDTRGRPINQSFSNSSGRFKLTLPPGTYRARVQDGPLLGPMSEFTLGEEGASLRLTRLTPARIVVEVRGEDAEALPAKVSVVGFVDPSKAGLPLKDHLFDLASGEAWRTDDLIPDDPSDPSTMRYIEGVAVTHQGVASIEVPPGRYEVYVSRGTEYELKRIETALEAGQVLTRTEVLKREVHSDGYISADFHLHAAPSLDSDLPLRRRVRTAAAEGLEHLVATDHNFVTDYMPFIEREGLTRWLSSMIGLELTTLESGHFNTFPIERDISQITRGSFEWSDRPPQEVFETARAGGSEPIIQVNHPRDQLLGYFSQYGFDALKADVAPPVEGSGNPLDALGKLIDPSGRAFFDPETGENQYSGDFDVIEVLNHGLFHEEFHARMPESLDPNKVYGASGGLTREELSEIPAGAILCDGEEVAYPGVIDDWFNLLNQGLRYGGTANSDSHHGDDIGYPRTYVRVERDDPSVVRADEVAQGVRDKAMTLSRGPFIELFVNGAPIGAEVTAQGGEVEVLVRGQAASWIDMSRGTLYVNGVAFRRFEINRQGNRFEWRETLTLPKDSWLIAQVDGTGSMFPVAPPIDLPPMLLNEAFGAIAGPLGLGGGELDELAPPMTGVFTPFAITNPIWVDIDGQGFEAPGLPNRACNGLYVEEVDPQAQDKALGAPLLPSDRQGASSGRQRPLQRRLERDRLRRNRATLQRSFGFPRAKRDLRDVRVMFEHFASHGHGGGG